MAAIRMDTDELHRLAQRMKQDVSIPLGNAQKRVEKILNGMATYNMSRVGLFRMASPNHEEFFPLAKPILRRAADAFPLPASRLMEACEKLSLAVKYFEEIDNASVGRQAALRERLPDWLMNREFALCLMMDMTLAELAVFFPYGNLLGDGPSQDAGPFLSLLQRELTREFSQGLTELVPGQPDSIKLWEFLDPANLGPDPDLAELYLLVRNPADIQPGQPEEDFYVRCVEELYAVKIAGSWPPGLRLFTANGVHDVAQKLGRELEKSGAQAFREVFSTGPKDHLFIVWGTTTPAEARSEGNVIGTVGTTITQGGYTTSKHLINFATISKLSTAWQVNHYYAEDPEKWRAMFLTGRNTMVHELGHAFCNIWITPVENADGSTAYVWLPTKPDSELAQEVVPLRSLLMSDEGFYGFKPGSQAFTAWRQHPLNPNEAPNLYGEAFADMFLGWTYDAWEEPGPADKNGVGLMRREYMNSNMPHWLEEARTQPWLNEEKK